MSMKQLLNKLRSTSPLIKVDETWSLKIREGKLIATLKHIRKK